MVGLLASVCHISLPWVSFGSVPGLSHEALSNGSGGLGIGSLSCLQDLVWKSALLGANVDWLIPFLRQGHP